MAFISSLPLRPTRRRPRIVFLSSINQTSTHRLSYPKSACIQSNAKTSDPIPSPSPLPQFHTSKDSTCGFAALVGPSNVGKSTLLNHILGQKLAIVSPKVQTTRCRISGIASFSETQVIFLDTPGVFEATTRLNRAMVKAAWSSFRAADAAAIILDIAAMYYDAKRAGKPGTLVVPQAAHDLIKAAARHHCPVAVVANKLDSIPEKDHPTVEKCLREIMKDYGVGENPLWMLSAKSGDGVDRFCEWVKTCMPKGPWLYPDDSLTEMPSRLIAEEVTREKAFYALKQELPYEIAVETVSFREQKDGSVRIEQDILVRRDSQRRIVTGQGAQVIKKIGMTAREELKEILGMEVHLMLKVKVKGKWKEDRSQYERWGLDFNA